MIGFDTNHCKVIFHPLFLSMFFPSPDFPFPPLCSLRGLIYSWTQNRKPKYKWRERESEQNWFLFLISPFIFPVFLVFTSSCSLHLVHLCGLFIYSLSAGAVPAAEAWPDDGAGGALWWWEEHLCESAGEVLPAGAGMHPAGWRATAQLQGPVPAPKGSLNIYSVLNIYIYI